MASISEQRPGIADGAPGQKICGNADRRPSPEANKLAFRQVKGNFCLDFDKSFGTFT